MVQHILGHRIRPFRRQQRGRPLRFTRPHMSVNLLGQRCHILDPDDPLVRIPHGRLPREPQLKRPVRKGVEMQIPLRIPLHPRRRPPQLPLPVALVAVQLRNVVRQTRVPQRPTRTPPG